MTCRTAARTGGTSSSRRRSRPRPKSGYKTGDVITDAVFGGSGHFTPEAYARVTGAADEALSRGFPETHFTPTGPGLRPPKR